MAKSAAAAASILKDVRALLEARADEKEAAKEGKSNGKSKGGALQPRSPLKALGVKPSFVRSIAREIQTKNRPAMDYGAAVALMDAAVSRKVREEILVALDVLERHRKDFAAGLFSHVEKWSSVAEDLEVAEALGGRVAAPALALEPAKINVLRKWARLRSVGKRRLAVLAAVGLVSDGRREAPAVLELAELLLHEDHPAMVSAVASLLRETTKVDAKAVQDFLFRRSVDGNPDILRAGSENLDAARRAALIAKLEAQAALVATT
jgi:3-methyladenine DNA glycosylase AlkD